MVKERVYERAVDTAKKIRKALKEAFPGVKFSVKSSTYSMGSSVYVNWQDGPFQEDVEVVLARFKSGKFDGMQDMYVSTGFEWEGKIVVGAKYVSGSRSLSPDRLAKIEAKLQSDFRVDARGYYDKRDWVKAERQLIEAGELQGYASKMSEHELVMEDARDVESVPPVERVRTASATGKVITFLIQVRDPVKAAELRAERMMNSLTPEQRLKMQVLQSMFGTDQVAEMLTVGKMTIDGIFKITADRIFGK